MVSLRPRQNTVLYFEVDGRPVAIDLNSIAAAACDCPMVFYEGLPEGLKGVVQWAGKIYPIFDLWNAMQSEKDWKKENPMFIFSTEKILKNAKNSIGNQVAIPLPYDVQLIHPRAIVAAPKSAPHYVDALVVTPDDRHAELLNIHKIIQNVSILKQAA